MGKKEAPIFLVVRRVAYATNEYSPGRFSCMPLAMLLTTPHRLIYRPSRACQEWKPIFRRLASGGITQSSMPSSSGVSNPPPCNEPASTISSS